MLHTMRPARILLEMVLCFLAFFLPGYLSQGGISARGAIGSSAMLQSIIVGVPQFLLLAYIASLSGDGAMVPWGFVPFNAADILRVVLLLLACFAIFAPFAFLILTLPSNVTKYLAEGFRWRLASPSQIPLAVFFGLVAGYREEFFFRSYLLKRLDQLGFPVVLSVAVSTLLFCAGHAYEGPLGLATAAALGVLFAAVYLRRRSLHVIAIAHGLYNATVLCLSLLHSSPLSNATEIGKFLPR